MNFDMPLLPERTEKPRQSGLTMVMDKGLSLSEAESLIATCGNFIDIIKLGFGTSIFTGNLENKIKLYKDSGMIVYPGGTLFEAFVVRKAFDKFLQFLHKFDLDTVEVSDGSLEMDIEEKYNYISLLSKDFRVLSEVGSKDAEVHYSNDQWVQKLKGELQAGSWKVITEARESGNVGIYNSDGKVDSDLIGLISSEIGQERIIWETPQKSQQVWFIKHFGTNVNLGNISPADVIALETLRTGLRGDTFFDFLPDELKKN